MHVGGGGGSRDRGVGVVGCEWVGVCVWGAVSLSINYLYLTSDPHRRGWW